MNHSFSADDISERVEDGGLIPVDNPASASSDRIVWVTPTLEVYLASKDNPINDKRKVLLHKITNP